jgi:hypothetical protein
VTTFSTAKRAQVCPLEQIVTPTGTDRDLNPNIVTIGSLDNMQHASCIESRGDQEDIVRGTRQRKFCPLPHLEPRRKMSITGVISFDPIGGINACIDVLAGAGQVSATSGRKPVRRMAL